MVLPDLLRHFSAVVVGRRQPPTMIVAVSRHTGKKSPFKNAAETSAYTLIQNGTRQALNLWPWFKARDHA
jgi:hypothetical protein